MDALEQLKKQWQTGTQEFPKLSYSDIYKMLLKKSSSIIKWIFIISIGELIFWTILSFFVPESTKSINDQMGLHTIYLVTNVIHYTVFAVFIFLFWKNYRSIQITDSVKELMRNILRTRRTVNFFVIYNIAVSALLLIGTNIYYYFNKEHLYEVMQGYFNGYSKLSYDQFTSVFFIAQTIGGVIMLGLVMLFYRLVYGILLRRLKSNYNELEKIEV